MAGHPQGNPRLNRQHMEKQHEGDEELAGGRTMVEQEEDKGALPPGRGKPDREEGLGTTQRQQR